MELHCQVMRRFTRKEMNKNVILLLIALQLWEHSFIDVLAPHQKRMNYLNYYN